MDDKIPLSIIKLSNGSEEKINTIAVFEVNLGGHYLQYARLAVKTLVNSGYKVVFITLQSNIKSPIFNDLFKELKNQIEVIGIDVKRRKSRYKLFTKQLENRLFFKETNNILKARPDCKFLLLPFLNHFSLILSMSFKEFGTIPYGGILLHNYFHMENNSAIKHRVKEKVKRMIFLNILKRKRCKFVGITDPTLMDYLRSKRIKNKSKIHLFNEPGIIEKIHESESKSSEDIRQDFRKSIGVRDDETAILVYGVINERKGTRKLINALIEKELPKVKVIVAGVIETEEEIFFNSKKVMDFINENKIVILNKYSSRIEEAEVFTAADIIWLGYLDFYSMSGVLFQAAARQKPVIACKKGLIGWYTKKYNLGIRIDPYDIFQIFDAIEKIINEKHLLEKFKENSRSLSKHHTEEQFCVELGNCVKSAIGE